MGRVQERVRVKIDAKRLASVEVNMLSTFVAVWRWFGYELDYRDSELILTREVRDERLK